MKRDLDVDLAVIGAGAGGLTAAGGAAMLGLSVVLFEHGKMGGDCLNYGCVPSKALIASAHRAHAVRTAGALGVAAEPPTVDFPAVMARIRQVIADIAPIDSQERFEGLGVTVMRETARFTGPRTVESDSARVTARRVVIATGTRAAIPPIPGLDLVPYLTNETVFDLQAMPEHLLVLGGGPIGAELGQAFRRLGARVTLVEHDRLLARDDPAAADVLRRRLLAEGLDLREGAKLIRVEPAPGGFAGVIEQDGREHRVEASHLLIAIGRTPNLEALDLAAAGVETDKQGVKTSPSLRTSNRRVFAVGDIAGRGAFTHLAGAEGSLFIRKALFALPVSADKLTVPRVTYTDPEIAAVGLTEAQARDQYGERVRVLVSPFHDNDRARAEGDAEGFAKLVLGPRNKILGVTIAAPHAGELIGLWSLVLSARIGLSKVAGMMAPYPTRGEIAKKLAGDAFAPTLFSSRTRALVSLLKYLG